MASPTTPRFTHSRDGSDYNYSPSRQSLRRHSRSSLAGGDRGDDSMMFNSSTMGLPGSNMGGGLGGNLADELADAWDDGEDEYYEEQEMMPEISTEAIGDRDGGDGGGGDDAQRQDGVRDSGVDIASPPSVEIKNKHLSLTMPPTNGRAHRRNNSQYDGSEYGSDSDLESPGMPSSLVAKIDAVESLARRGTENNGGPTDGVFHRVTDGLRDLSSQSNVESHTSRLITAHTALTTHLHHQTRQLHNLTFPLLNPLAPPPDPDTIDALLPEITTLQEMMPRPSQAAFNNIIGLQNLTSELVQSLSVVSDTLQVSRQVTTTATRRLRTAKELVADMRRDDALREEGELWLARGNWGERLQRRECASVCAEITGGFEEVCDGWRARLAQSQGAAAQA